MAERDRRREILQLVAQGDLTPDEAAQLLAEVETSGTPAASSGEETEIRIDSPIPPPAPSPSRANADADGEVVAIRVHSNCRAVSIVGDPDVHTAVAEGDHVVRMEGDVLTIESTLDRAQGFAFIRGPGLRARGVVRASAQYVRPLTVRMNPDLALDSEVEAGSLTIRDVRGPIRAHTSAGAMRVEGFESPIELRITAGSATARGRMTRGSSRIECDAGKVSVRLTADSSVKVRGQVNLGQLNAPDRIGDGDGELEILATLGAVEVGVEDE